MPSKKKTSKNPSQKILAGVVSVAKKVAKATDTKVGRSMLGSVKMSSCAGKLAMAIANPFSEEAKGCCFPMYPAPDSHKATAFSRVEGTIGTAGVGFVVVTPALGNNVPSGYVTGATFAGTNLLIMTAASTYNTGVTPFYHNGPYTAEQLLKATTLPENSLAGRIVSVGLRNTYTGTTLNESGLSVALSHPIHGNISGAFSTELQAFPQCTICPFTRKPCTLALTPAAVQEVGYPANNEASNTRLLYPFNSDYRFNTLFTGGTSYANQQTIDATVVSLGAPVAGFMVTGVAGSTFHVDIIYHLEYTGSACAAASTPNSVDVVSTYAILTAAHQLSTRKMQDPGSSDWKLLMDGIVAAKGSPVVATMAGLKALI